MEVEGVVTDALGLGQVQHTNLASLQPVQDHPKALAVTIDEDVAVLGGGWRQVPCEPVREMTASSTTCGTSETGLHACLVTYP